LTADRSVGALPSSLKAVALFEAFGELVEADGGILEFSDLLKRPLDAFKYLQHTAETGEVSLSSQNLRVNSVMIASVNEVQLEAFKQHHEFESFRGRLEPIRAPYLLSYHDEQAIYDTQIAPQVRRHVAPHATEVAAMFAVLTRMRKPNNERYAAGLRDLVAELSSMEKLDLYADGTTPDRLDDESAKRLKSAVAEIFEESDAYTIFEGSVGASPREMRTVLLDASQNPRYQCLSPFAVLEELDRLCERTTEYVWLQEEPREGHYHDHREFRRALKERLLDSLEDEFRTASGLLDDTRPRELFDRYVTHVSYWIKGEKVRNPMTGDYEDPDVRLMEEVEVLLQSADPAEQLRHSLINRIAAWAIDHPGMTLDNGVVFAEQIRRVRQAVFSERREAVARLTRDVIVLLRDQGSGLSAAEQTAARAVVERLAPHGYEEPSTADAAGALVRERFADLLS
jgi:predicted Ser/Thr protein kinase